MGSGLARKCFRNRSLRSARRLAVCEPLEQRQLLSITPTGIPGWTAQGPGPIVSAGNVRIPAQQSPAAGAVQAVAPSPVDPKTLYASAVNGGVWVSHNIDQSSPTWTPLLDGYGSTSMGDISVSPLDPTGQTIFAATGLFTSGIAGGTPVGGIYKSTDGGASWNLYGQSVLAGLNVRHVIATKATSSGHEVILASAEGGGRGGVFQSIDGGLTYSRLTTLPAGDATALVSDGTNSQVYYTAIVGAGIYRNEDAGDNAWTAVNNPSMPSTLGGQTAFTELACSAGTGALFAAIWTNTVFAGVFRSTSGGTSWTQMDTPGITEPKKGVPTFFTPGVWGGFVADPTSSNIVYISGGPQPIGDKVPNSIGATSPSGFIMRGDASQPSGSQWLAVTDNNANSTAPHADGRSMNFLADGSLVECDDGGIYKLSSPNSSTRTWSSLNGTIQPTEFYTISWDPLNNIIFGGAQDVGSPMQNSPGDSTWTDTTSGDGAYSAADIISESGFAYRYTARQNLGIVRNKYDSTGTLVATTYPSERVLGAGPSGSEASIGTIESNLPKSTIQFAQPWVLNTVDPTRMLVGTNYLYESLDRGDTFTSLGGLNFSGGKYTPNNNIGPVNAMVYGGMQGGIAQPQVMYVGTNTGEFLVRASGSGMPVNLGYPGTGKVKAIATDPDDWRNVFVVDTNGQVFESTNGGFGGWSELTGNLPKLSTDLRSLTVAKISGTIVLLAGGLGGVYRAILSGGTPIWTRFGTGLPANVVRDLHYYPLVNTANGPAGDLLLAGTWGRGAWILPNASDNLLTPATLDIQGTSGNDDVYIIRDGNNPLMLDVFLSTAGVLTDSYQVEAATLQEIDVSGLDGNDSLTIDNSNGLIDPPTGIHYDGGLGADTLNVIGTPADNSIEVTGSKVTVDSATYSFTSVINLSVNGGDGADTFSVHDTTTHTTLSGGNGDDRFEFETVDGRLDHIADDVTVDGGLGRDTLILNDNSSPDANSYFIDSTSVTRTGPGIFAFPLTFTTISLSSLVLNGGTGDDTFDIDSTPLSEAVTINGSSGTNLFRVAPVSQSLLNIKNLVTLNAGPYNNALITNDQNDTFSTVFGIDATTITRTGTDPFAIPQTIKYSEFASLVFNGGSGNDEYDIGSTPELMPVTVNGGNGDDNFNVTLPIGSNLAVNGGGHVTSTGNRLSITGTGSGDGAYTPGPYTGSGSVSAGGHTIAFTGLQPVNVSAFGTFKLTTPGSHDEILLNSPDNQHGQISGSSDGVTFESLSFMNIPTIILDTGANNPQGQGNDNITVGQGGVPAVGLSTLRFLMGSGQNTLNVWGGNISIDAAMGDGSVLVAHNNAVINFLASQTLAALGINDSARVNLAPGGGKFLRVSGFSMSQTAMLDLANNSMIVDAPGNTPPQMLGLLTSLIRSARNTKPNLWQGFGITSSAAAHDQRQLTGLGITQNQKLEPNNLMVPIFNTFAGQQVNQNSILIRYTWNGDMNLDGIVNFDDYFQINTGFLSNGQLGGYRWGDLNFDNLINFDDYFLINSAFLGQGNGVLPVIAGNVAAPPASFSTSPIRRRASHRHSAAARLRKARSPLPPSPFGSGPG